MATELERPDIDFLILADRAEGVNGKLYLMGGGWDRLSWPDLNAPIPFSFAVGILVPWNHTNEPLPLTISIEDEDHNKVVPEIHTTVSVGRPSQSIPGQSFRAIIAVNGLWKLPKHGTYVVRTFLGGRPENQRQKTTKFYLDRPAAVVTMQAQ